MTRVRLIVSIAILMAMTTLAGAQDYPNRLIKLMHGFPPGGNVDVLARIVAEEMSKGLGQTIVIEAKPGVVGSIAAETVTRSPADGYTLLFLPSAHTVTAAIYKSIKYNAVDDFAWISTVSFYPFVLCVPKDSKFRTIGDLLQYARANPGRLTYGSTGAGRFGPGAGVSGTRRTCPRLSTLGFVSPLADWIDQTGTPNRRASELSVSPARTV